MRVAHKRLGRMAVPIALLTLPGLALAGCGGGGGSSGSSGGGGGAKEVKIMLLTKDATNPFWLAMQKGAQAQVAKEQNAKLTLASGKADGDEQSQVDQIEQSIARGDDGILIAPNGPGVNPAIKKARDQGMHVIALDTPFTPVDTAEATLATDNFEAGQVIGKWMAAQLNGQKSIIAMLPAFNDKIISVDTDRYQGFLDGMGINLADKSKKGDEAPTGKYTGGKGGDYQIVCSEASQATVDGGKTAMERCLSKSSAINTVYSINEPDGEGAAQAVKAANSKAVIVSVDGGCQGVQDVKDGILGATAQQYPVKMAEQGVQAIVSVVRGGELPKPSAGKDFVNTGVKLVTDKQVTGLDSIDTSAAAQVCWGTKK
jgi:fructose transport system substrate-binding protein